MEHHAVFEIYFQINSIDIFANKVVVFHFWINTSRTIVIFHNYYLSDDKNI